MVLVVVDGGGLSKDVGWKDGQLWLWKPEERGGATLPRPSSQTKLPVVALVSKLVFLNLFPIQGIIIRQKFGVKFTD